MPAKKPAAGTVKRTVRELTLEAATDAARAAIDAALESGLKVCAAVVDLAGNPLVTLRHPGAPMLCVTLAEDKAYTCAQFGIPSADWRTLLDASPALARGLPPRPRWALIGGGLPIRAGGELVGGIGVSGGSEEQDAQCALAGLRSLGLD